MRKKSSLRLLAYLLALVLLAGCGGTAATTETPLPEETDNSVEAVVNEAPEEDEEAEAPEPPKETPAELDTEEENRANDLAEAEEKARQEAEAERLKAEEEARLQAEAKEKALTQKQRDSINMLNYLTVMVQKINSSSNSRLFLESAYSELINNTEPSIVNDETLFQYEYILSTIEEYRMTAIKRDRLQYLYEQNCAAAIRNAMPDPLSILSLMEAENWLKSLVSVAYLAIDSANSYLGFSSEMDTQYLQSEWSLDDEQAAIFYGSRASLFSYMVRESQGLPEGLTLNEENVAAFVKWTDEGNVTSRIRWLESNRGTYENYGEYWLVLARSYYEKALSGIDSYYQKCLEALSAYEELENNIFRKDSQLARTLPYAMSAARECLEKDEYEQFALRYAQQILDNTTNSDWGLRYFAAQTYLDIYSLTGNEAYLGAAYEIVYDNVNELVAEQRTLNREFLAEPVMQSTKNLKKDEKKQVKAYNDFLKETRKTELCPIYEPLRLNCELLFGIAEKLDISPAKQADIDIILHPNGEPLFLNPLLDNKYRFSNKMNVSEEAIQVSLEEGKFEIPAVYLTGSTAISVSINDGEATEQINDWTLTEVRRGKSHDVNDFVAVFKSEEGKKADYPNEALITISVSNDMDGDKTPETLEFTYRVNVKKSLFVINSVAFERLV